MLRSSRAAIQWAAIATIALSSLYFWFSTGDQMILIMGAVAVALILGFVMLPRVFGPLGGT